MSDCPQVSGGFTLLELVIVMALLSLIALAVIPDPTAANQAKVDLAAEKVAAALRFARSEAIRTSSPHGVIVDQDDTNDTGKDIVVYQIDFGDAPFGISHILNQPVSKQAYDIDLADPSDQPAITIRSTMPVFSYVSSGPSQHVHFDANGRPVYYAYPAVNRMLSGSMPIGTDDYQRTVSLSAVTGQVSVQ